MSDVSRRCALGAVVVGALGGTAAGEEPKAPKLWELEGELRVHPKYLYRYYLVLGNGQLCALYGADHSREPDLLVRLKPPARVRVRGVLGTAYHSGGTRENLSPFPATWTLYMDVHEAEALK
jgi:hypothetical protein